MVKMHGSGSGYKNHCCDRTGVLWSKIDEFAEYVTQRGKS